MLSNARSSEIQNMVFLLLIIYLVVKVLSPQLRSALQRNIPLQKALCALERDQQSVVLLCCAAIGACGA